MSDLKKQSVWTEDGRVGEKVIKEVSGKDGKRTVFEELWVEPKIEKRLAKKVAKHYRPVVHMIETEIIDEETQEVLDRKVESIDHESKMEVRRHITSEVSLSSATDENDNPYVTRQELHDALVTAFGTLQDNDDYDLDYDLDLDADVDEPVSAQALIAEHLNGKKDSNLATGVLMSICGILSGGILWVLFMM